MSGKFNFEPGCRNGDADEGALYKRDGQFNFGSLTCYLKYMDGVWLLCNETSTYRRDHNDLYRLSSKGKHYNNDLLSSSEMCFILMVAISNSLVKNPLLLDTQWEGKNDSNVWSDKATVKIFNNEEEYNQYRNANKKA